MSNAVSKLFKSRFGVRLAVPAVVAVGAVGTAFVYPQVVSASTPTLASETTSQVIGSALAPTAKIYSGTVVETSGLGLPSSFVNQLTGSTTSGLSALMVQALTSGVTANFWTNHVSNLRVQVPSSTGEFDLYASSGSVWEWNSATNTATSITLPTGTQSQMSNTTTNTHPPSPSTIANSLLAKLPSGATVTFAAPQYVAGQAAYVLSLAPNDPSSLIGSAQVAVDASTGNVLGVWITPTGSTSPAFSVYYSAVSFTAPSSSVFDFTVPSGATVKKETLGGTSSTSTSTTSNSITHKTIGSGFSAVEVVTGLPKSSTSGTSTLMSSLLSSGTQVTTGIGSGTIITTSVATVFVGSNGTLAFGAVPQSVMMADLGQG
ncbi:MAG: hypothetical protein M0Z29_01035 [Actinomycetota bacterium]|nr:hypothetical protein [Actinomycetota bacterium]